MAFASFSNTYHKDSRLIVSIQQMSVNYKWALCFNNPLKEPTLHANAKQTITETRLAENDPQSETVHDTCATIHCYFRFGNEFKASLLISFLCHLS